FEARTLRSGCLWTNAAASSPMRRSSIPDPATRRSTRGSGARPRSGFSSRRGVVGGRASNGYGTCSRFELAGWLLLPRTADATASVKGYYIEPGSYNFAVRMSRLPFRLQLDGTVDQRTTTLLTRILDSHIRNAALSDILEIIETADELVLWQLARQLHERNV